MKRVKFWRDAKFFDQLDKYGREGVAALASATPVDTSLTANSWTYEVINEGGTHGIRWRNTHMAAGTPVVILLQYGHGTGTGGYVQGRDFINPVILPLFERIKADVRKAVSSA
jgi:hypothetical protein